jgi:chitodextrinase
MSNFSRRRFMKTVGGATLAAAVASQVVRAKTVKAAATDPYTQAFLDQYGKIKDPASGYFSKDGIPYHSVETLMAEAPDYGHETTSEAFSFWMWLEATYGRVTGDWAPFNNAWATAEKFIIPSRVDQPSNDSYNPASPATYAPEFPDVTKYPSPLDSSVASGQDPIAGELKSAYGTSDIYGMHWLLDVDNIYGYGNTPGTGAQNGPTAAGPSYINSYQRGSEESVWETIPQPTTDLFKAGGPNGYLDLFIKDQSYAKQWKYTNAPDADARAVQAAYWAFTWASAQGNASAISASVAKAARMGDYLRYAMFDKYFKRIGNCTDPHSCPAATGRDAQHYLLAWYYAWGGAEPGGGWAWRIGDGAAHQGYQNPLAAWALSNVSALTPKSPTAKGDWSKSLGRQLEFLRWLQSAEGAIAGGATNSWNGQYAAPPAGDPTFYGMAYDFQPVYHDPPSNNWFGFQAWGMERVAEYYFVTGDATAKALLDKWVTWASGVTTANPSTGDFSVPSNLSWSGQPDTWDPANPGKNAGLHVSVVDSGQDVGVAAALIKTLLYYASKSGSSAAQTLGKNLLDALAKHTDSKGIAIPEVRKDYNRFDDPVFVPAGYSGTMPNGDPIAPGATFVSIRSWYKKNPDWAKIQAYLDGGAAPTFTYHRFWAQADVAMAFAVYAELFEAPTGTDTQAPTAPTGLTVTGTTSNSASLSWTAATDNVGVTGYLIFRNGAQVGASATTTFTDTGLTASTSYAYSVKARDAAGNVSAASGSATAVTASGPPGGGAVTATYHVDSDWGAGFTATVTVTNNGTAPTASWHVAWSWAGNQKITNFWNAAVTQNGTGVAADNASFNAQIAPGTSTTFGFQASYSGTNTAPTLTAGSTTARSATRNR